MQKKQGTTCQVKTSLNQKNIALALLINSFLATGILKLIIKEFAICLRI